MNGNHNLGKTTKAHTRHLVQHLISIGNSPATVAKKIGHLRAAANIAIDDGKISLNPFERVTPKYRKDRSGRHLIDDDMKLINANLHRLSKDDQLLWKLLACTGMRLGEAFHIDSEDREEGIRYVTVGSKTETSLRRLPIPFAVLNEIPGRIIRPLFAGEPEVAGKRIRYFLRQLDISFDAKRGTGDKKKVIHSLRHRAKDRLRIVSCPIDIQYEILGHEKKTIAAGYGNGYPMKKISHYINMIGFK